MLFWNNLPSPNLRCVQNVWVCPVLLIISGEILGTCGHSSETGHTLTVSPSVITSMNTAVVSGGAEVRPRPSRPPDVYPLPGQANLNHVFLAFLLTIQVDTGL